MRPHNDVDDQKFTPEFIDSIIKSGSVNVERENALLLFMYQNFPLMKAGSRPLKGLA
jgi:hypothetical protein